MSKCRVYNTIVVHSSVLETEKAMRVGGGSKNDDDEDDDEIDHKKKSSLQRDEDDDKTSDMDEMVTLHV